MSPAEAVKVLERMLEAAFVEERDLRRRGCPAEGDAADERRDRRVALAVAIRALGGALP